MPSFSIISSAPEIRRLVQENILERAFHDALFPRMLFRAAATPVLWPANIGDSMVFTGVGLMTPDLRPLTPGTDPAPGTFTYEQWSAQLQQYAGSIDTAMPDTIVAIANLFLRNAQQLGMKAAQSMNRMVRNRMYGGALSGWTTCVTQINAGALAVDVYRLNGFTRARNPALLAGSPVKFEAISTSNPLTIYMVLDDGSIHTASATAFTPTNVGDEVGTGNITFTPAIPGGRNVPARGAIYSIDRTSMVRVGGGMKDDDVGANDYFTFASLRSAVARLRLQNVPEVEDGRYHGHLDPVSEGQFFSDAEVQRMLTSLPDYYMYRQFAIGEIGGVVLFRNTENPLPETVYGGTSETYSLLDPFPGQMYNNGNVTTGVKLHRVLMYGAGSIFEYYKDLSGLITEAGLAGKVGDFRITNNSITVASDRIQLIIREPLNRLQDLVSTSYKFIGDWPVRTDCATGDAARHKRQIVIAHGE